ncbi:MAG: hypothetical protein PHX25_00855 [Candidatus Pacebacteria bacterium]|nr:hypothetical protein [Candidatus Paceibacterota bacterium]
MALLRIRDGETKDVTIDEASKIVSSLIKEDVCCGLSFCEKENCIELNLKSGKKIKIDCRCPDAPLYWGYYFSVKVDIKN